ncbi:hypothetical protein HaLaN_31011 [Haematococcus lacustris]|uniref:Uncharacterized protein n=1 Tax=Haematococcus lacustris TaxID=44745 RepID=A0A6A0AGM1_HAELA|nr:hypothetical protein HaLaN_31011 [Haematococcus lacustris]
MSQRRTERHWKRRDARCRRAAVESAASSPNPNWLCSPTRPRSTSQLSAALAVQPLLQTVDRVQQLVADLRETLNRNVVAKERSEQEWDRAQVDKEKCERQPAADKASGSQ